VAGRHSPERVVNRDHKCRAGRASLAVVQATYPPVGGDIVRKTTCYIVRKLLYQAY